MPDPKWIAFQDAGWRRYVFAPRAFTIYEQDCLRDLAAFVEARTAEHRAAAKGVAGG